MKTVYKYEKNNLDIFYNNNNKNKNIEWFRLL